MMTLQQRIKAFSELGHIMHEASSPEPSSKEARRLRKLMDNQEQHNKWFTPDNVLRSVQAIAEMLDKEQLEKWLKPYNIADGTAAPQTIAVIMAGNIPLVGFHDLLCVLITGNKLMAHTSSKDSQLIREVSRLLAAINSGFGDMITLKEKISPPYDAVIATGSNNTARYFDYYFGNKPHIFRKNRNSVAIIESNTAEEVAKNLALDIFTYFGLGCRNVSKIYFNKTCRPEQFISYLSGWEQVLNHRPYANNYLYNKSLFRLNKETFLDNGFMLFKKDPGLASPVAVTYYDCYSDRKELLDELLQKEEMIQCIVSEDRVPFGRSQYPGPSEYADNVDTIEFIASLT